MVDRRRSSAGVSIRKPNPTSFRRAGVWCVDGRRYVHFIEPFEAAPNTRTVDDRRISIAIMIWKLHSGIPARLGSERLAHSWRHPMTTEDPMMVGAATVFVVADIAKSTEHYRD